MRLLLKPLIKLNEGCRIREHLWDMFEPGDLVLKVKIQLSLLNFLCQICLNLVYCGSGTESRRNF